MDEVNGMHSRESSEWRIILLVAQDKFPAPEAETQVE